MSPAPKDEEHSRDGAARRLRLELDRNRRLREERAQDRAAEKGMQMLREWQVARLKRTHADLLASARYRKAASFFLSDIYGPQDFAKRDESIERVYSSMVAVLPPAALHTIALAVEVHVMSTELDRALWKVLTRDLKVTDTLTEDQYVEGFRRCANRDVRLRQVKLIRQVGEDLDDVAHRPMLGRLLKLARRPAKMAGFGELQDFLERGFEAFRSMNGAGEFLDFIDSRETAIIERIFAGDPAPLEPPDGGASTARNKRT
jgi:hypothetical protein